MIQGRHDTYLTIDEFAQMINRSSKTIRNWHSEGKIQFVYLCGVPLISLLMIENLLEGRMPVGCKKGELAARLIGRVECLQGS